MGCNIDEELLFLAILPSTILHRARSSVSSVDARSIRYGGGGGGGRGFLCEKSESQGTRVAFAIHDVHTTNLSILSTHATIRLMPSNLTTCSEWFRGVFSGNLGIQSGARVQTDTRRRRK